MEQKLIDICFQIGLAVHSNEWFFREKSSEQVAEWIATQLSECGFPTRPVGGSWGILEKTGESK